MTITVSLYGLVRWLTLNNAERDAVKSAGGLPRENQICLRVKMDGEIKFNPYLLNG